MLINEEEKEKKKLVICWISSRYSLGSVREPQLKLHMVSRVSLCCHLAIGPGENGSSPGESKGAGATHHRELLLAVPLVSMLCLDADAAGVLLGFKSQVDDVEVRAREHLRRHDESLSPADDPGSVVRALGQGPVEDESPCSGGRSRGSQRKVHAARLLDVEGQGQPRPRLAPRRLRSMGYWREDSQEDDR